MFFQLEQSCAWIDSGQSSNRVAGVFKRADCLPQGTLLWDARGNCTLCGLDATVKVPIPGGPAGKGQEKFRERPNSPVYVPLPADTARRINAAAGRAFCMIAHSPVRTPHDRQ